MTETQTETKTESRFAGRHKASDILGISSAAMLLVQRDGFLPPECVPCGKVYWQIKVLKARRAEVREWLAQTYPDHVHKLIVSE